MSTRDYTRNAHRRTIWATLQRFLMDRYIEGDTPAKEPLLCEEVFFADKEVGQEALMEVIEELRRQEANERIQMTQYEFRRRHVDKGPEERAAEAREEDQQQGIVVVAPRRRRSEPTRGPAHQKGGG